jgi:hypothetical protein
MGCIPSYETIGFMAPLLVLILLFASGLALGGRYGDRNVCSRRALSGTREDIGLLGFEYGGFIHLSLMW